MSILSVNDIYKKFNNFFPFFIIIRIYINTQNNYYILPSKAKKVNTFLTDLRNLRHLTTIYILIILTRII